MKLWNLFILILCFSLQTVAKSNFAPEQRYWQKASPLESARAPQSEVAQKIELFRIKEKVVGEYLLDTSADNCVNSKYDQKNKYQPCY